MFHDACYLCQKNIGFFDKKIPKFVEGQKVVFCPPCANAWPQQQKNKAISLLYSGGDPTVLFTIPSVITHYQDEPGKGLLGPLLFTNKALCFAQFAEAETKNPLYNFGFKLGSAIAAQSGRRAQFDKIGPEELQKIIFACSRLIVLPKDTITEIEYKNGVQVKIGNKSQNFKIHGNKKEASVQFESLVRGYLQS